MRKGLDLRSDEAKRYRKLYNTARWQRTRAQQLSKHPLCQRCMAKGYVVEATICHHVDKDSKSDPERFYIGPFQSLCAPCHDSEAQQEERIGFNTTIGADGWPTSPNHPANR